MRACYRKIHKAVADLREAALAAFSVGLEASVPASQGPIMDSVRLYTISREQLMLSYDLLTLLLPLSHNLSHVLCAFHNCSYVDTQVPMHVSHACVYIQSIHTEHTK